MINKLNIRGYINYLYLQRNGSNAPQELLQKWSALSDQDIQLQLQNLYASWHLNSADTTNYEQMYDAVIRATAPPVQLPKPPVALSATYTTHQVQPHQTQQAKPYVPEKKSSNTIAILLGVLLIGGLIGFGVWWMQFNRSAQLSEDACKNNASFKKLKPGIEYKLFETGKGELLKDSSFVKMHIIQKAGDSTFVNTYKQPGEPVLQFIAKGPGIGMDYSELFFKMRAGDSTVIRLNQDSVFKDHKPSFIKKTDQVLVIVKFTEILGKQQRDSLMAEQQKMNAMQQAQKEHSNNKK